MRKKQKNRGRSKFGSRAPVYVTSDLRDFWEPTPSRVWITHCSACILCVCLSVSIWIVLCGCYCVTCMWVFTFEPQLQFAKYFSPKTQKIRWCILLTFFPQPHDVPYRTLCGPCCNSILACNPHSLCRCWVRAGMRHRNQYGYYHRLTLPPFFISPQGPLVTSTHWPLIFTSQITGYIEPQ